MKKFILIVITVFCSIYSYSQEIEADQIYLREDGKIYFDGTPFDLSNLDSTWNYITVENGVIFSTNDTLKNIFELNDSTLIVLNQDTICIYGCSGSSGITALIEDLTPQLGGDLDLNTNTISVGESEHLAEFGSSSYYIGERTTGDGIEIEGNSGTILLHAANITATGAPFVNENGYRIDASTYIQKDGSNNLYFADAVTGSKTLSELTSTTLPGLTDYTETSVADNDIVAYDNGTGEYINQDAGELGIATTNEIADSNAVRFQATENQIMVADADGNAVGYPNFRFDGFRWNRNDPSLFIGKDVAYNRSTTGTGNIFLGYETGYEDESGNGNVYIGYRNSYNTTNGGNASDYNVSIGYMATYNSGNGMEDGVFIGRESGYNNSGGNYNTYLGAKSGYTGSGTRCTYVGYQSGYGNGNNSDYNVALGYQSGYSLGSSDYSLYLGSYAGKYSSLSGGLFVNSYDRGSFVNDTSLSIIFGVQNASLQNQRLRLNANLYINDGTLEQADTINLGLVGGKVVEIPRGASGTSSGITLTDVENNDFNSLTADTTYTDILQGKDSDTLYVTGAVQFKEVVKGYWDTISFSVSMGLNYNVGYNTKITTSLTNNATVTVSGVPYGITCEYISKQDATGGRTLTISGATEAGDNNGTFNTDANAVNVIYFTRYFDGVYYYVGNPY